MAPGRGNNTHRDVLASSSSLFLSLDQLDLNDSPGCDPFASTSTRSRGSGSPSRMSDPLRHQQFQQAHTASLQRRGSLSQGQLQPLGAPFAQAGGGLPPLRPSTPTSAIRSPLFRPPASNFDLLLRSSTPDLLSLGSNLSPSLLPPLQPARNSKGSSTGLVGGANAGQLQPKFRLAEAAGIDAGPLVKKQPHAPPKGTCQCCDQPAARLGPNGRVTLCNNCGVAFHRQVKKLSDSGGSPEAISALCSSFIKARAAYVASHPRPRLATMNIPSPSELNDLMLSPPAPELRHRRSSSAMGHRSLPPPPMGLSRDDLLLSQGLSSTPTPSGTLQGFGPDLLASNLQPLPPRGRQLSNGLTPHVPTPLAPPSPIDIRVIMAQQRAATAAKAAAVAGSNLRRASSPFRGQRGGSSEGSQRGVGSLGLLPVGGGGPGLDQLHSPTSGLGADFDMLGLGVGRAPSQSLQYSSSPFNLGGYQLPPQNQQHRGDIFRQPQQQQQQYPMLLPRGHSSNMGGYNMNGLL